MSWVAVAMAGVGLVYGETTKRDKENRDRKLASATQRYAPWTGLKADPVQEADPLGSAVAFGTTGLGIKKGMEDSNSANALSKAKTEYWQSQTPVASKQEIKSDPGPGRGPASARQDVDPDEEDYRVVRRKTPANPWYWS